MIKIKGREYRKKIINKHAENIGVFKYIKNRLLTPYKNKYERYPLNEGLPLRQGIILLLKKRKQKNKIL